MNEYAKSRLTPDDFRPTIEVDAEFELGDINDESVAGVLQLAPFGFGNPAPVFATKGVTVPEPPVVMKEKHLRLKLRQNGRQLQVKAWNFAPRMEELRAGTKVDAVVSFEPDSYSGWSATLKDVRSAG
jgi:single-stranded-DNA-specific exonuclease